jgi:hypothetical protein
MEISFHLRLTIILIDLHNFRPKEINTGLGLWCLVPLNNISVISRRSVLLIGTRYGHVYDELKNKSQIIVNQQVGHDIS